MKPLLIVIILVFMLTACQKKDNNVTRAKATPVYHIIDTPIRKIDSNNYYPGVDSIAYYAGLNCDSLYSLATYFMDTILVYNLGNDSIRIRDFGKLRWEYFKINNNNFYSSSDPNGYAAFTFSGKDSLSFNAVYDNPCSNSLSDEYNYIFKGRRYK